MTDHEHDTSLPGEATGGVGEPSDVPDTLRRDLQDGEDLALAIQLVSDALDRRLERVRRSLRFALTVASPEVEGIASRLERQIDEQREVLDQHRDRLRSAVQDVQDLMESAASELGDDDD